MKVIITGRQASGKNAIAQRLIRTLGLKRLRLYTDSVELGRRNHAFLYAPAEPMEGCEKMFHGATSDGHSAWCRERDLIKADLLVLDPMTAKQAVRFYKEIGEETAVMYVSAEHEDRMRTKVQSLIEKGFPEQKAKKLFLSRENRESWEFDRLEEQIAENWNVHKSHSYLTKSNHINGASFQPVFGGEDVAVFWRNPFDKRGFACVDSYIGSILADAERRRPGRGSRIGNKEPIVLDASDWNGIEWNRLCSLFRLDPIDTVRIRFQPHEIEYETDNEATRDVSPGKGAENGNCARTQN